MTWRTPAIAIFLTISVITINSIHSFKKNVLGKKTSLISPSVDQQIIPTLTESEVSSASASIVATEEAKIDSSPSATPTKIITPTPTPKTQPEFSSEEIYKLIERYSQQYSVDPNVVRHMAICESGFNPKAKNGIYAGLFQFDTATWKNYRLKQSLDQDPDLRYHAEEAIRTATFALSVGGSALWPGCYPK